ncbi:amino acid adenylation domain-containing protein [Streptomyces sp. NPDC051940]|uniref:amino acid adenylation domain-containing protein n=1 Tax=Streptomyces sp. NPDC051940 TaxID=3155675 RepID=UPI00343A328F
MSTATITERLLARSPALSSAPGIAPSATAEAPLSFEQERLWLAGAEGAAYNSAMRVDFDRAVDAARLQRALETAVAQHAVLRTSFHEIGGDLVQRRNDAARPQMELCSLSEGGLEEAIAAEARRPFTLSQAPLLRATLYQVGTARQVLLVVIHHLVSDGWFRILFDSLERAYAGVPAVPGVEAATYADYARRQRAGYDDGQWSDAVAYWRDQLADAEPVQLYQAHNGAESEAGGVIPLRIDAGLARELRRGAASAGASPFMLLLAGLAAMAGRYTRSSDVTVGVPVDGRIGEEFADTMGFFVNILPIRTDLTAARTFAELAGAVRDTFLDGYEHRTAPVGKVLEELRADGVTWMPTVVFNYDSAPGRDLRLGAARGTPRGVDTGRAKFDLNVYLSDEGEELRGALMYRTGVFSRAAAESFADQWLTLLRQALAAPGDLLADLGQSAGARPRPESREAAGGTRCLHEWFEAAVDRDPDAVALSFEGRSVSYAALERWANALAHRLRTEGVGPGDVVGLCAGRSPALLAGLLGILKAGAAYLPLDPGYPEARLAMLLEDSGARVVLGDDQAERRLPGTVSAIGIGAHREGVQTRVGTLADPRDAAYVIYTSGSTGRPKGVLVSHANVSRLLSATESWYGFGPQDTWTLFHSPSFDFSVWEIWGALAYGGRLVIVPEAVTRSPENFADLLDAEGVTVLNQTPSAFAQLTAAVAARGGLQHPPRLVVFGGEALDFDVLRTWYAHVPEQRTRLVNMYGITETTVHVTYRPLGPADADSRAGSLIGTPIPDLSVHLLDKSGRPVPEGVPGEIHVCGAGLAMGYLGDPAKTAQRFVPSPFGPGSGARMYRTGDLALRTPDGDLRYLGRIDQQVKLRGFRLELGEITAAIRSHPAAADAVVDLRRRNGIPMLVGYVVPTPGAPPPTVEQLRGHLEGLLPAHAVPTGFVLLETLPLTRNGKLDREALPEWHPGDSQEGAQPRTPTEQTLARIIAELLGVEQVGVRDNFFHLGGDSIVAMQVTARARAAGLTMRPTDLLTEQTVERLAARLTAGPRIESRTGHVDEAVAPMQAWFANQAMPDPAHWHQSLWLTVASGPTQPDLERALTAVATGHPALSRPPAADASAEPAPLDGPLCELLDLRTVPAGHHAAALRRAVADTHARIDHARGRMLAALYVMGLTAGPTLLVAAHHLAVDAVSWPILIEDLTASCRGAEPLPPSTPMPQWAGRLAAYTRTAEAQREAEYWMAQAKPPAEALPADAPQAPAVEATATTVWRELDESSTAELRATAARSGGMEGLLLTGAALALRQWSGAQTVRIDVERHGRDHWFDDVDITRTIGWFTAVFPLTIELGERSAAQALEAVAGTLATVPRRGVGFGALRYLAEDDLQRKMAALPEPEAAFNYLGERREPGGDRLFTSADRPSLLGRASFDRSPQSPRSRLLAAEAVVASGRLRLGWTHDARIAPDTAAELAELFVSAVRDLTREAALGAASLSTADLSRAGITGNAYARIRAALREPADTKDSNR